LGTDQVENEVTIDPYDLIFADIVIKGKNLVIEVDGPKHYLAGQKLLQVDTLNRMVIETLGYQVKTVNAETFDKMKKEEKEAFLGALIN
jgi:very-short-patch-repair endonuclease